MKYIVIVSFIITTLFGELYCHNMDEYRVKDAGIQVCPISNTSKKVYLWSMGSNYHTCNLEGIANEKNGSFVLQEDNCTATIKFFKQKVYFELNGHCNDFCGVRAWWNTGYLKKTSN